MSVKVAPMDDLESIITIDSTIIGSTRRKGQIAATIEIGQCIVSMADGVIAGFATFDISFFGHMYISLVSVHPEYWRNGVASSLIQYISERHAGKLFTSTNQSNIVMQKVCESIGFVRSGFIENLDDGDPEIIYFKAVG